VHHGSYIRADHKLSSDLKSSPDRRQRRLWLLLSICSCAVLSVVLANSEDSPIEQSQTGPIQKHTTDERRGHQSTTRVSLHLPLPRHENASSTHEGLISDEAPANAGQALLIVDEEPPAEPQDSGARGEWHEVTVKSGDTLSSIFSRLNIYRELPSLMELGSETEMLEFIYPGQDLHIRITRLA
jgi:hypothetical protein